MYQSYIHLCSLFTPLQGHRNGKKLEAKGGKRTEGSMSLLRLLKNNLNI